MDTLSPIDRSTILDTSPQDPAVIVVVVDLGDYVKRDNKYKIRAAEDSSK